MKCFLKIQDSKKSARQLIAIDGLHCQDIPELAIYPRDEGCGMFSPIFRVYARRAFGADISG
jgi:hypothetical protein